MSFESDLNFGKYYETQFALLTKKRYIISQEKDNWDIKLYTKGKEIIYEIKTDRIMNKTGNIGIEFECFGKPSGINNTCADYWVFNEIIDYVKGDNVKRYKYNMYIISTNDLRKIIDNKDIRKSIISCGDFKSSRMYLIKKEHFKKYLVDYKNDKEFYIYKKKKSVAELLDSD